MRKLILILVFLIAKNLIANPIIPPPVISEFYLNGGNWQLEVYFAEEYQGMFMDFSELRLICNNDTASFVDGLTLEWNTIIVIDQNSLSSPFNVNLLEDWIYFSTYDHYPFYPGIQYGGPPVFSWNITTTPHPGESIVQQFFSNYGGDDFYSLMKDESPTIGYNAFESSSRGVFSGYIFDQFNNPVPDLQLVYCAESFCWGATSPEYSCIMTDENGYFETDGLFCNWHLFKLQKDGFIFLIDTMFFEPDSVYYKEYVLNSVGVAINDLNEEINILAAPNPFTHKTTFHLSIPDELAWNEARITIRNINGQIIDFIPLTNVLWAGNDISVDWYTASAEMNIPPGLYLYTLEIDNNIISSQKMIINE